jgi:hypothetical protein
MSTDTYRLLHLGGVILLFLGLGGVLIGRSGEGQKPPAAAMFAHGLGLLLVLAAGFALESRLGTGFPGWLWAKLGVWVVLGALPFLVRRGIVPASLGWLVALALGVFAVWLVLERPFP